MNTFKHTELILAALPFSVVLILSGCGGGGSPASSSPFSATTEGVGAKGIIKNATVTAYELSASGAKLRTVGTSQTDVTGKYSLTIGSSYTGGTLKLELAADGTTTKMVCDVAGVNSCGNGVSFGQDFTLPAGVILSAYQQSVSNGAAVKTQITPYTNMAVARVEAQLAGMTTTLNSLVGNANSEVSQIVGVDITNTEPVDITKPAAVAAASPEALQYAAFNAGVGKIAFASGANGFQSGINAVAASFADGRFDSTDTVKIGDIVTAVGIEAAATPALNTTTLTATLNSITTNTSSGIYDPAPSSAATQTAVAQARELVSQTRTWGTSIAAFKTPADAFGVDIDTASAVLNSNSAVLGEVFGKVMAGGLARIDTEGNSLVLGQTYTYAVTYGSTTGTGSVRVSDNSGNLKLDISAATIAGVTSIGAVTTNIPVIVLSDPQAPSILNIASLTMNVTGGASMSSPAVSITLTNAAFSVALKSGKTIGTVTGEADIQSIGFDGSLVMAANGVTFTGTGKISIVANNVVNPVAPFSLAEIALSGTFTGSKGSANASASVKFNNAATFDVFGLLSHQPNETANNFANATITVSSNVALTGNPAATLTVTANRTAYGGSTEPVVGNVVAILAFNGQSVKFEAANTAATPTAGTGTLTITNPSGVKLVLTGTSSSPTGTVSVGTTQVGTISSSSGMTLISYNDGTFESLN